MKYQILLTLLPFLTTFTTSNAHALPPSSHHNHPDLLARTPTIPSSPESQDTQTQNLTERILGLPVQLQLLDAVGVCVKLAAATTVHTTGTVNSDVYLAAGVCVCVDLASDVRVGSGNGGVSAEAELEVTTSVGAKFSGDVAVDIATKILLGQLGLGAYAGANICLTANLFLDLAFSQHDFTPSTNPSLPKSCCARSCISGYHYDTTLKKCIPGCPTGEVLCNGNCYNPNTHTCASGVPVLKGQGRRKRQLCATGWTACPLDGSRSSSDHYRKGSEGGWECIDTRRDIESCGGCIHSFNDPSLSGVDCTALPNIDEVSCLRGSCIINSCSRGFELSSNGTVCEPSATPKSGSHRTVGGAGGKVKFVNQVSL